MRTRTLVLVASESPPRSSSARRRDVTQFFSRPASALLGALTLVTWALPLLPKLWRARA